MSSILFSETKGGRANPLRNLSENLERAGSSSVTSSHRVASLQNDERTREEIQKGDWEDLEMSNVWNEVNLEKAKARSKRRDPDKIEVSPEMEDKIIHNLNSLEEVIAALTPQRSLRVLRSLRSGLDDLADAEETKRANLFLHGMKIIDNLDFEHFDREGFEHAMPLRMEDLAVFHHKVKNRVAKEINFILRKVPFYQSPIKDLLESLLKGKLDYVGDIFHSLSPIDKLSIFYASKYLGLPDFVDWESYINGIDELGEIIENTIRSPAEISFTPLENYLLERGDLPNYLEIILELQKGNVLPGARHSLALYHYFQSRTKPNYFFFDLADNIYLDKILTGDITETANTYFFQHEDFLPAIPVYSNPSKWSEFFVNSYRYLTKSPRKLNLQDLRLIRDILKTVPAEIYLPSNFNLNDLIGELNKARSAVSRGNPSDLVESVSNMRGYYVEKLNEIIWKLNELNNSGKVNYLPTTKSKL